MHSYPDAVLMLADSRCRELQDESAQLQLAREAYGDDPTALPAISTACRQLRASIVRTLRQLESIRWTMSLTSRGVLPR